MYVHTDAEMGVGTLMDVRTELLLDVVGYIGVPLKINNGTTVCRLGLAKGVLGEVEGELFTDTEDEVGTGIIVEEIELKVGTIGREGKAVDLFN